MADGHKERVLSYMREHGSITSMEAIREFGCTRLSAVIWALRHDGHDIDTEIVSVPTRYGKNARVARYSEVQGK